MQEAMMRIDRNELTHSAFVSNVKAQRLINAHMSVMMKLSLNKVMVEFQ